MCSCVGSFSGANCESECNVKKLIGIRFTIIVVNLGSIPYFTDMWIFGVYLTDICTCNPNECCKQEHNLNSYITQNDDPLILSHFITISLSFDLSKWRNAQ